MKQVNKLFNLVVNQLMFLAGFISGGKLYFLDNFMLTKIVRPLIFYCKNSIKILLLSSVKQITTTRCLKLVLRDYSLIGLQIVIQFVVILFYNRKNILIMKFCYIKCHFFLHMIITSIMNILNIYIYFYVMY